MYDTTMYFGSHFNVVRIITVLIRSHVFRCYVRELAREMEYWITFLSSFHFIMQTDDKKRTLITDMWH